MVLFWLMWFGLVLWGAFAPCGTVRRVGHRLAVATGWVLSYCPVRGRRVGRPWPPGGIAFPFAPRVVPASFGLWSVARNEPVFSSH